METVNLQTIGLMGGMSSAATAEYYEIINRKVKEGQRRTQYCRNNYLQCQFCTNRTIYSKKRLG